MTRAQEYVLALDLGSSTARTLLVNADGHVVTQAREAITWERPRPGWVEVDPQQLWQSQLDTVRRVTADLAGPSRIAACAVTDNVSGCCGSIGMAFISAEILTPPISSHACCNST